MTLFKKKWFWFLVIILIIVVVFWWRRSATQEPDFTTVTVKRSDITETIDVTGEVIAENSARLSFDVGGDLVQLDVEEGQRVQEGVLLARLSTGALGAQYAEADKRLQQAQQEVLLARRHWNDLKPEEREVKKLAVEQARAARAAVGAQIGKTSLRAPFEGTIGTVFFDPYETVAAFTPVLTLLGDGTYVLEALTPESDVGEMRVGQMAEVTFDAFDADDIVMARITDIARDATELQDVIYYKTTLAFDVCNASHFDRGGSSATPAHPAASAAPTDDLPQGIAAPDDRVAQQAICQKLRVGMSADIDVVIARKDDVLLIPQRVLREDADGEFVTVLLPDGTQERRAIMIGVDGDDGTVEILSGLAEGDQVVVEREE